MLRRIFVPCISSHRTALPRNLCDSRAYSTLPILAPSHRLVSLSPVHRFVLQGAPTCSGPSPAQEQDDRKGDSSPWDELNGEELAAGSYRTGTPRPLPSSTIGFYHREERERAYGVWLVERPT